MASQSHVMFVLINERITMTSKGSANISMFVYTFFLCFTRTVYRNTAVEVAVPYRPSVQKKLYGTGMPKAYPFWPVIFTAVTVIRYGAQPYLREVGTTFVPLCKTTRRLTRDARRKKKSKKEKSFEEAS